MAQSSFDLWDETYAGLRAMPKTALACWFAIGALAQATSAGALRLTLAGNLTVLATGAFASLIVGYLAGMAMLDRPGRLVGFLKFLASTLVATSLALVGFLLVALGSRSEQGGIVFGGFVLLFAGVVASKLLVGWPLWEASASGIVGPLRAFQETRGIRGGLLVLAMIFSVLDRFTDRTTPLAEPALNFLIPVLKVGASTLSQALGLAVAVAAYRYMTTRKMFIDG